MDYKELITSAVTVDEECGANLEDDAGFQNFFFEAEGTPERFDGQTTIPAEPPEWRDVKKTALSYFDQTRDLKLISILTQSVLNTEGLVKFEQCLAGLSELVETQWQYVYPPLDEDDGDPLERISALGHLNDKAFVVDVLKHATIAEIKGLGKVTLQVIENIINGDETTLTKSQVQGILHDSDAEELTAIFNAVNQSAEHLEKVNQTFISQAGNSYNINFDKVCETCREIAKHLEQHIVVEQPAAVEDVNVTELTPTAASQPQAAAPVNVQPTAPAGATSFSNLDELTLHSRADVEKCFQAILTYYRDFEPSSPVPILMNRAQRFIQMDFLNIIKDISPDSLQQLLALGGMSEQDMQSSVQNTAQPVQQVESAPTTETTETNTASSSATSLSDW
ncbi:type VI secretion system ImpA family N-terminal domain-containing protein [Catenovulum sp. SM1970]|uniref:type VI secretion system protein TssA n=1 Tax=Marinifaba aquimaris TaxID=2741323 RepID=UPI001573FAD1|nr:type VI secretion system ImpA family N-terminal domain-containing protein [Marinifaba aquimaris]NTS75657.1 type VI secretion system ImpA family N-terminal domain-containing protein [Marinifaba aquimaris]